ncbi:MAG: amidohydrolase [Cyclobacteriaceae bacterium]|jgi:predicted amidohydrolase YtcJ|nr:amidohydrolase [Cyclobacteriaceae bacterium]
MPSITLFNPDFMRGFILKTIVVIVTTLIISCTNKNAPDLVLLNGKVWTGESDSTFAEAIAIKENKIIAVGTTDQILKLVDSKTNRIDLNGKLVTAGFNDAHIHFLSGSLGLTEVDILGTNSPDEVAQRVNQFIEKNPGKEWITGRGWQYTSFESSLPDSKTLNAISNEVAVFIKAYDGHSAWANKKALALAGIDRNTTYDGFGEIVKDKKGEPTGTLRESAMDLVIQKIPVSTRSEKLNALRKGITRAASLGITSMQNANGTAEDLYLLEELLNTNELTLRYAAAFSADENTTNEDVALFTRLKDSVGVSNPRLRADAIKFMIDGVIESHTGYMLQPYSDVPSNDPLALGQLAVPIEKYQNLVTAFDKNGFRIYTHAIGDKGVRESLNAYENAAKINGKRDARHRVEHIETVSPDDIPRFAQLGVMASMEPIHADPGTIEVWANAIGEARLPWSFAWGEMIKHKAYLVYSSDWPACIDLNPIRGIHVAVNRKTPEGLPPGGWIPEQKISIAQALKAYTSAGAYSSFEENLKGQIKPGQLADIIVFSQDLFTIDPMKTYETKVALTVFDGKVIYNVIE